MASPGGLKAETAAGSGGEGEGGMMENQMDRGLKKAKKERGCSAKERISKMPPCIAGKRSSIYRGVTRHRWTGRYEAHLWDKTTWNQNQNKKGKQVYLGAYDDEEAAARAYDLAALKYWGPGTLINFPVNDYLRDLEEMQNISREDYLASLRRKSSGFARGISKYRGLSRPSQGSRWETSFGQMGVPDYLTSIHYGTCEGTSTESEYPRGFCIERKIDLTNYIKWWGANKIRRTDTLIKSLEETKCGGSEDVNCELKALEWGAQRTEPYKLPFLGFSHRGKKHEGCTVSALSILSRSGAYKSLKEKVLKDQDNNENHYENKCKNEIGCDKLIKKLSGDGETHGVALSMSWLPYQRTSCPLTPFLSAPLLTNCNTMDPLADTVFWRSLGSVPSPTGPALIAEVTKTETSSTYPCFHQDDH